MSNDVRDPADFIGELLLFNNLTWAHSTGNRTPQAVSRQVAAAFA